MQGEIVAGRGPEKFSCKKILPLGGDFFVREFWRYVTGNYLRTGKQEMGTPETV
ncbi:hypothetical protein BN1088_1431623 [Sphingobacterium sp. PM2-P1-29]|nr:hypothetical protein BN1088_1431623 [Sphingobacterium sp. PM2-P1-29]